MTPKPTKENLLSFIRERHIQKQEEKRDPHFITFREINEHFNGSDRCILRELVRERKLEWGRTINDLWFAPHL